MRQREKSSPAIIQSPRFGREIQAVLVRVGKLRITLDTSDQPNLLPRMKKGRTAHLRPFINGRRRAVALPLDELDAFRRTTARRLRGRVAISASIAEFAHPGFSSCGSGRGSVTIPDLSPR